MSGFGGAVLMPGANDSSELNMAVCTIIAKNFLPFARVFTQSFTKHHPDIAVFVLLVDKVDGYFQPELEAFRMITVQELGDKDISKMLFNYNVLEACTALKPYVLQYLFKKYKFNKVAYFDADILITSKLDELWYLLDEHPVILTPHLTEPIPISDKSKPSEIDIMKSGTFNLGFIGLNNNIEATHFLDWWRDRLSKYCINDPNNGLFADQKWVDLAPGYFEGIYILRDATYNVAFWNLQSRPVNMVNNQPMIGDRPLQFFHFSGFDPENIDQISKHQDRFTLTMLPGLKPLFEQYRRLLLASGYSASKSWPYAFSYFDNGVRFPDIVRRIYLGMGEKAARFGDPFTTGNPLSFFDWLKQDNRGKTGAGIVSRLWHAIYLTRPDLQVSFPDLVGKGRQQFLMWTATSGVVEYNVDKTFLNTDFIDRRNPFTQVIIYMQRLWISFRLRIASLLVKLLGKNSRILKILSFLSRIFDSI
jgi:hypothetical protein